VEHGAREPVLGNGDESPYRSDGRMFSEAVASRPQGTR
jgi:hypothetical protein